MCLPSGCADCQDVYEPITSTVVSTVAGNQHPLAFLLGPQGVALLRALAGDNGRFGDGIDMSDVDSVGGYRVWAGYRYDMREIR